MFEGHYLKIAISTTWRHIDLKLSAECGRGMIAQLDCLLCFAGEQDRGHHQLEKLLGCQQHERSDYIKASYAACKTG